MVTSLCNIHSACTRKVEQCELQVLAYNRWFGGRGRAVPLFSNLMPGNQLCLQLGTINHVNNSAYGKLSGHSSL
ncbi:hypothetical protein BgiBS90_012796, partial [Biomphalaria glabrata]